MRSQHARKWWYLAIPLALAMGVVLAIWLRTSPDDSGVLRRGATVDLSFAGNLADDRRHSLLVVFGYTRCPDVCPTTLLAVHQVLDALGDGAAAVIPVFITVDPARDSEADLQRFVGYFDARIQVIGTTDATERALREFRTRAVKRPEPGGADYSVDHTAVLYVLDPQHRVSGLVPEAEPPATVVRKTLEILQRSQKP